jgi:Kelch motif protein/galactose oxidase-like protein
MTRRPPLNLALALSVLALGACNETTAPTQPATADDPSLAGASSALTSNIWTAKAAMPEALGRQAFAVGVANNAAGRSIVYVLGGIFSDNWVNRLATSILAYDVVTDTWTTKAAVFGGVSTNGVGRIGSKLYISGGYDYARPDRPLVSSLFAYDLSRDRMIRKADMPRATALGVTGVINGKLYVLAGACLDMGQATTCRSLYRYDPASNAWTTLAPAPRSHYSQAVAGVIDGKFYVTGGGSYGDLKRLDVYDPATNTWKALRSSPQRRTHGGGAVLGGKLYVVLSDLSSLRDTYAYDPVTDRWRNKAPFPEGQSGSRAAARVTLNGRSHMLAVGSIIDVNIPNYPPAPSQLYTP